MHYLDVSSLVILLQFLLPTLLAYVHVYECTLSSLHEFGETGK